MVARNMGTVIWTYSLRRSEIHTLTEIGKLNVIAVDDLAKFTYASDLSRLH